MAATGKEVALLEQLKILADAKQDVLPAGENGYILTTDGTTPSWDRYSQVIPNADSSRNGLMTAADKGKLDSLSVPEVQIKKVAEHSDAYDVDTLEIVVDSTGKVTGMWFVTAETA